MPRRALSYFSALLLGILSAAAPSSAAAGPRGVVTAGVFNSPKGFGLSAAASGLVFVLYADIYGIPRGRQDTPGIKFNLTRCRTVRSFGIPDGECSLYFGPGVSLGWVHDLDNSVAGQDALAENPGVCLALSGRVGIRADFPSSKLSLDVSLTGEAGMHVRRDEWMGNLDLSLYKAGLHQLIYPQLTISRRF